MLDSGPWLETMGKDPALLILVLYVQPIVVSTILKKLGWVIAILSVSIHSVLVTSMDLYIIFAALISNSFNSLRNS